MTPEELTNRAQKIGDWFSYLDELYTRHQGRCEGGAEGEGFDSVSTRRPCEHRRQWRQGQLCLACDNTGWRRCAVGEDGFDPYGHDPVGEKKELHAMETKVRDNEIERLERLADIRAGTELTEDQQTRQFRLVAHKHRTLGKILSTLNTIRLAIPDFRARSPEGLRLLAMVVPGRIQTVPE